MSKTRVAAVVALSALFCATPAVAFADGEAPAVDTTKPIATLVTPVAGGLFNTSTLALQLDATDAGGLNRVTANIYKDGVLFKSTSSAAAGATSFSHRPNVALPDGEYTLKFNASDLAGNVSATGNVPFEIDTTAPTITVKPGAETHNGYYWAAPSFALSDAGLGQVDYVEANGTRYERTNNKWSDLNAGNYRAVQGLNTITLFDTAGNSSTFEFLLDSIAPTVVSDTEVYQTKEGGRWAVTLVFSEPVSSPGQGWNGSGTTYTKVYYRAKTDSISVVDAAQHPLTYSVVIDAVVPAQVAPVAQ